MFIIIMVTMMVMIVYIIIVIPARPPFSLDNGDNHYYDEDHGDNDSLHPSHSSSGASCLSCLFLPTLRSRASLCHRWDLLLLFWL